MRGEKNDSIWCSSVFFLRHCSASYLFVEESEASTVALNLFDETDWTAAVILVTDRGV